jgi:MFS family permease
MSNEVPVKADALDAQLELGDAAAPGKETSVEPPPQDTSERWRQLVILGLSTVLALSSWFSSSALLPQLKVVFGVGDESISLLTVAVNCGFMVGATASSITLMADRHNPRYLFSAGSCTAAVCNALMLVVGSMESPSFTAGFLLRFVNGMAYAFVYPCAMKIASSWFVKDRGLAFGTVLGTLTVGSALPSLVIAFGGLTWQQVIVATSLMVVIGGSLPVIFMSDGPHSTRPVPFSLEQLPILMRNRELMLAIGAYTMHNWELYGMWAWYSDFAEDILLKSENISENQAREDGHLIGFFAVASGCILCVAAGRAADAYGRTLICILSLTVSAACSLFAGMVTTRAALWPLAIVWGMTIISDSAQYSAMVSELGDPSYTGTCVTLQVGLGYCTTIVSADYCFTARMYLPSPFRHHLSLRIASSFPCVCAAASSLSASLFEKSARRWLEMGIYQFDTVHHFGASVCGCSASNAPCQTHCQR